MNPYLTFNGNCEAAFKFYEARLGGKIGGMMPFEGSPMAAQVPAEHRKKIMHASISFDGNLLMGSDTMPGQPYEGMKGFSLTLSAPDVAEAERLFAALAEGGSVIMPLAPTFWAARFGMLKDQFGVPWMVNCETPAVQP
jgi:PhnB protein